MKYSPLANSAAYAVSSNGIGILKMPKYADKIAKTIISRLRNGLMNICWVDSRDEIIYDKRYFLPEEAARLPMIGEVIEQEEER